MPNQHDRKYATKEEAYAAKLRQQKESRERQAIALAEGRRPNPSKPCERVGCNERVYQGLRSEAYFNARRYCSRTCSGIARTEAMHGDTSTTAPRKPAKRRTPSVRTATPAETPRPSQPIWRPSGWAPTPNTNTVRKAGTDNG